MIVVMKPGATKQQVQHVQVTFSAHFIKSTDKNNVEFFFAIEIDCYIIFQKIGVGQLGGGDARLAV